MAPAGRQIKRTKNMKSNRQYDLEKMASQHAAGWRSDESLAHQIGRAKYRNRGGPAALRYQVKRANDRLANGKTTSEVHAAKIADIRAAAKDAGIPWEEIAP